MTEPEEHKDILQRLDDVRGFLLLERERAMVGGWDAREDHIDHLLATLDDVAERLQYDALLTEREAIKPFIDLAVATTVEGSPDYREWVGQANDWLVVFSFAGQSITLGQLRALAALSPPNERGTDEPGYEVQAGGRYEASNQIRLGRQKTGKGE